MTTDQPSATDFLNAYREVHGRIVAIMTDDICDTPVPTCPGWSVGDVLAHLNGLCEDWVDHRLDGYASEGWTAAQVARNRERRCSETLDRWADSLDVFAHLDEAFIGSPPARWAFGDAVIHEADIRGALGCTRVPDYAVALALTGSIGRWHGEVLRPAGLPTLHVRAPDSRDWWLGTPNNPDAVTVETPMYEIFRALAGRRSPDQVRAWSWSSNPDPYIAAGLPYPFHWAIQPLTD